MQTKESVEKFRTWIVTFTGKNGDKKHCSMGGEMMDYQEALAQARVKWADADVEPLHFVEKKWGEK